MKSVNTGINRRAFIRAVLVTLAAVGALAACAGNAPAEPDQDPAPDPGEATQALARPGGSLTAIRLTRAQADVAQSGAALAAVLSGRSAPVADVSAALARSSATSRAFDVSIAAQRGLQFSYRADNDQHLAINQAVTSNLRAPTDIGKNTAHTMFLSAFHAAVAAGAVPPVGLNPANARSSRIVQGEGRSGQPPVEKTSEYVFTVPRMINGVEIFDAGFEVSVHRAGQLARMKTFGPTVASPTSASGATLADASSFSFAPAVSAAELGSRVAAEHPRASIRSIGMRYWLPPGAGDAVVEPTQMYFVVPTATVGSEQIHARGFYVSYSLRDRAQAPTVWPRPEQNPPGDGRK